MKKILVIAICVLVILIGIIAFDKYSDSKNQQQEEIPSAVTQVSTYIDNGVEKTTVIEIPTKDPNALVNFTMPISHLPDEAREDMKKILCGKQLRKLRNKRGRRHLHRYHEGSYP